MSCFAACECEGWTCRGQASLARQEDTLRPGSTQKSGNMPPINFQEGAFHGGSLGGKMYLVLDCGWVYAFAGFRIMLRKSHHVREEPS